MKAGAVYVCFLLTSISSGFLPPPFLAPHPTLRATEFRVARAETRTTASTDIHHADDDDQAIKFQRLCEILYPQQSTLVRLDESEEGVRGVYASKTISKGDVILTVPLEHCLRDDDIPFWMGEEAFDDDTDKTESYTASSWAKRLAGSLLDVQLDVQAGIADEPADLWLSLLPEPSLLRASLPVHWNEDVIESAHCTALDLAVDSAYFARAEAVSDLLAALERCEAADSFSRSDLHSMAENALDIVQTRTCRVISPDDGTTLRILAPLFDMLNHRHLPNAAFDVETVVVASENDSSSDSDYALVVRATERIEKDSEIFISYGVATKPSWRCLASYGFVQSFDPSIHVAEADEDDVMVYSAEIFLEGTRYEVGPDSVPQELVDAMAECIDPVSTLRPAPFTKQIALRLAQRISEAAFQMLLDDSDTSTQATIIPTLEDDNDLNDNLDENWSLSHIISSRQAAALRWNQHRILMSCSLGLRDWVAGQPDGNSN
jgi:hypothetical protein